MHFEILVEDSSGLKALAILIPKIIERVERTRRIPEGEREQHTFKLIHHTGLGRIPKDLQAVSAPYTYKLLEDLPKLLKAYGASYPAPNSQVVVIVVCDLDYKNEEYFRKQLLSILDACDSKPETRFCLASEEGEAWLLGDIPAIKAAYPNAKDSVLNKYVNDSICGTWEILADAVYEGGHKALNEKGDIGYTKSQWAEKITPHMAVDRNASPSFAKFRTQLRELAGYAHVSRSET